jgi:hypothetical protein
VSFDFVMEEWYLHITFYMEEVSLFLVSCLCDNKIQFCYESHARCLHVTTHCFPIYIEYSIVSYSAIRCRPECYARVCMSMYKEQNLKFFRFAVNPIQYATCSMTT